MKWYTGGQKATKGSYWEKTSGEIFYAAEGGAVFPGGVERQYLKMPAPVLMMVAPMLGLGYVMFLPLIGVGVVVGYIAQKVSGALVSGTRSAAAAVVPNWVPGVSYLARKGPHSDHKASTKPEVESLLHELEQEINEKRQRGEK